jgi:beta-galactosidase
MATRTTATQVASVALLAMLLALGAFAFPPAQTPRSVDLNGAWRLQAAKSVDAAPAADGWQPMNLPGQAPGDLSAIWIERELETPAAWAGSRWVLRCELLEQPATVFVDGVRVGVFEPPGDALDLTAGIRPGARQTIRLFVARDAQPRLRGVFEWAGSGSLGVTGSLRLDALAPQLAVVDAFLMPSVRQKVLHARVDFHAVADRTDVTLSAHVAGQDGQPVHTFSTTVATVPAGESTQAVRFPWDDPVLWELDRPYLYTIRMTATAKDGAVLDTWGPESFGFREFWVDGREMMLNGHPCRFRLLWHWGVGDNNVAFFQGIGMNAIEIQPRNRPWFSVWGRHDEIDALADVLDHHGMALIAPLKSVEGFDPAWPDPRTEPYYTRACRMEISRYKKHPSLFVWNLGMNICVPRDHWMPPSIGQALTPEEEKVPVYTLLGRAAGIVQKLDPTRSVLSHADGNTTPIATANVYLNLIPLQEREEWLSAWGTSGKKPFSAVEFGPPYFANFWHKGAPDPQYTEYSAVFLGDEAYRMEGSNYVAQVAQMTLSNPSGHGGNHGIAGRDTAFFPVVTAFVRRTTRAWRTWGQNGGNHPWMWNVGFGGEPSGPMGCFFYTHLTGSDDELRRRPPWANPYYDVYRETQQPLLVYLGGPAARFTAKDHAFFPGETMEKQVVAVWDAGWPTAVTVEWEATLSGARIAGGTLLLSLTPAEIRKVPITFALPALDQRANGEIRLKVTQDGREFSTDLFRFQVIPRPTQAAARTVLLWDPAGDSDWVRACGVTAAVWQPGQPLNATDLLIIGRNALSGVPTLPFTADDLNRGLTVIVLEQQRDALRRFGFRAEETVSRRLFARRPNHPLLRGLEPADLADWRGSATLVPDVTPLDLNPARPRCMHWGNYGAVASVLIETPHHGAFTPIVDGEFDLRYTPLLEWRCGAGRVLFSQFDLTARVGTDPVASTLAHNLVDIARTPTRPANRQAVYIGGPQGQAFVARLQLDVDLKGSVRRLPLDAVVILGEVAATDARTTRRALDRFVESGGCVLSLPKTQTALDALLPFTVGTQRRSAHRVDDAASVIATIGDGLGPADLHWRDFGTFDLFTAAGQPPGARVLGQGFFLQVPQGKGRWLLSQVDPQPFEDAVAGTVSLLAEWPEPGYSNDGSRKADLPKPWLRLTRQRIDRLYAQLIANLGVDSSPALVRRMMTCVADPELRPPAAWQVSGPIRCSDRPVDPEPEWRAAHTNELSTVAWQEAPGGWTPSIPYRDDDFGCAYYARTIMTSSLDHEVEVPVRYKASFHTSATVWFNGRRLADLGPNRWCPRLATESVVTLKPGRNELLIRCGRTEIQAAVQDAPDVRLGPAGADLLYRDPVRFGDDPYAWFPW